MKKSKPDMMLQMRLNIVGGCLIYGLLFEFSRQSADDTDKLLFTFLFDHRETLNCYPTSNKYAQLIIIMHSEGNASWEVTTPL